MASIYQSTNKDGRKHTSPFGGPVICEGERCAKVLQQFGWPSLATVLGASNVSSTNLTPLRHFERFLILRDNDKAGIEYCRKLAVEVCRVCPQATVYVCNLMPDIPGGDVVDWIKQKPLFGQAWNGFQNFTQEQGAHVEKCLSITIMSLLSLLKNALR